MELPAVDFGNVGLAGFVVAVVAFITWRGLKLWLEQNDAQRREQAEHQREMDKQELERRRKRDEDIRELLERDRMDRIASVEAVQALVHSTSNVIERNTDAMNGLCDQINQDHRAILKAVGAND